MQYSYHILKNFGTPEAPAWLFYWPSCSFGEYCTSETDARAEFEREEPMIKLVRYPTITNILGGVRGITGTAELLCEK